VGKIHAKLSPSGSGRWINCPGSVHAEQEAIENGWVKYRTSIYADEGTAAHELAERTLLGSGNAFDLEGVVCEYENAITFDREMCAYVQQYVDFVRLFDGELGVEQRVKFTDWVPDGFGTSDAIIVQADRLVTVDLKYGKGVRVHAEGNTQALCYALGAYQGLGKAQRKKIETVLMVIHQPRLDHVGEWEISIDDLLKEGERIRQAAEEALTEGAKRVPGDEQCRWCVVEAICPERMKLAESVMSAQFDDLTGLAPVNKLSDDKLRLALENKALIVSWLDAVEKHVVDKLTDGEPFDGFKLVEGRSLRQWADVTQAAQTLEIALGDDAYTKKILSPSQAEKALGKTLAKDIQPLIVKPSGKPTLAPSSDPRPSVNISADDF